MKVYTLTRFWSEEYHHDAQEVLGGYASEWLSGWLAIKVSSPVITSRKAIRSTNGRWSGRRAPCRRTVENEEIPTHPRLRCLRLYVRGGRFSLVRPRHSAPTSTWPLPLKRSTKCSRSTPHPNRDLHRSRGHVALGVREGGGGRGAGVVRQKRLEST